jgi:hypothetical protein
MASPRTFSIAIDVDLYVNTRKNSPGSFPSDGQQAFDLTAQSKLAVNTLRSFSSEILDW